MAKLFVLTAWPDELGRRLRKAACLAAVTSLLSGCAGAHFYNAENDKIATAAKEASDRLDLVDVIAQERSNQAKLLTHEIAVVSDFAIARRDTALRALLEDREQADGSTEPLSDKLKRFTSSRLAELAAPSNAVNILDLVDDWAVAVENLGEAQRNFLTILAVPAPSCAAGKDTKFIVTDAMVTKFQKATVKAGKKPQTSGGPDVKRALVNFGKRCVDYQSAWSAYAMVRGAVGSVTDEWRAARDRLEGQEAAAESKKTAYKEAVEAYKGAAKANAQDPSVEAKESLQKAIEAVQKALDLLAKESVVGKAKALEEQIDQIDQLLAVASTGELEENALKNADEKTKNAMVVAAQLPSLVGRIIAIGSLAEAPPINALLFEKERLLALKQDADKQVMRTKARIALLERKRNAVLAEIEALANAEQYLQWAVNINANNSIATNDLLDPEPNTGSPEVAESARRYMIMAIATYLNSFTGPRRLIHETEYRLIDVDHAEALDRSETALRLWENAVKQPVTVLAAYHGSGTRQEDIIELLKATGLFFVGAGVN